MSLTLHYHPLSSFCWKVLIALYELDLPFETVLIDFGDPESVAAFKRLTPLGKMPVLVDDGHVVTESSIIIEYLDRGHRLRCADLDVRAADRVFDLYVHQHMQKIVADIIRPADAKDPYGVGEAREALAAAYDMIEADIAGHEWAVGDTFTLADCAAAPALWYGKKVAPLDGHPAVTAYLARLTARPSFARVLEEAKPWLHLFPG